MTRETTRSPNPSATAVSAFPAASTTIDTARTHRRSTPPSTRGTTGAVTAVTRPVIVRLNPAVPEPTPKPSAMGVSTPTGSISEVTTTKVDRDRTASATHCQAVVWWEPVPAEAEELMLPRQATGRPPNNGDLLADR